MYYCKRDEDRKITALGEAEKGVSLPEMYQVCPDDEARAWMDQRRAEAEARRAAEEAEPSPAERLRADVDYIAAMTGVSL